MGVLMAALWGSSAVRIAGLVFLVVGGIWAYGAAKEWQGEVRGQAEVVNQVEAKANQNARQASEIRDRAAKGIVTRSTPYVRP